MDLNEEKINRLKEVYKKKEFTHFKKILSEEVSELISWDFINSLLWSGRILPPRLRLVKEGGEVNRNLYFYPTTDRRGDKVLRISEKELYKQIQSGATLIINSIEEFHPKLENFVEKLERTFHTSIDVNAYLSWKNVSGFKTHWDGHDVFVIQIYGKKEWFIFEGPVNNPTYQDYKLNLTPPTKVKWNQAIERGDILYIPRGVWHHAIAFNEPSLHLTFGLRSWTGDHFLSWMSEKLHSQEIFRQEISPLQESEELKSQYNLFAAAISDFIKDNNFGTFSRDFLSSIPKRTKFSLPYIGDSSVISISETTQIGLNARFIKFDSIEGNKSNFIFLGKQYQYHFVFEELYQILQKTPLSISDLYSHFKEKIEMDELKNIIEKAIEEGLLYMRI